VTTETNTVRITTAMRIPPEIAKARIKSGVIEAPKTQIRTEARITYHPEARKKPNHFFAM